jgi:shikimate kinase
MSPAGRHLVLVGLMGAGKTTIGEACARRLDRPFVDTDALVELVAQHTVPEIFASEGEARFREREHDAVISAVHAPVPAVIACGGGAVVDPRNRTALRTHGIVVWLRAEPDELARRVGESGAGATRPLLDGRAPATTLRRLALVREPAYEAAAHATVDTDSRGVDDVVAEVLRAFEEHDGR